MHDDTNEEKSVVDVVGR